MADITVIDPSDDGSDQPLPLSREVVASLRPFRSAQPPAAPQALQPDFPQPAPSQPQAMPSEEVIEIAPHPTTNRYPWTPIENPRLPVMQQPAVAVPVAVPAQPAVLPQPRPLLSQPTVAPQPVVTPLAPEVQPQSVAPPPIILSRPPAPKPIEMARQPEPAIPAMLAEEPTAAPPPQPEAYQRKPITVYSESTRRAWQIIKPHKLTRFMVVCAVAVLIGLAVFIWMSMGRPTSADNVPFLHHLLHAE